MTRPICGTRGTFKDGANSSAATGPGLDAVVALIEPQKMGVLFTDRIRRLVHSRV